MIKVLGLALYGPLAASTRYRLLQYCSGLADNGIQLEMYSLLDDEYLSTRFSGRRLPLLSMFRAWLLRLVNLATQRKFDCAIIHCELLPLMPGIIESQLLRIPYIYDFDDAFYLKYKSDRFRFLTPLLGNKFDSVISRASVVTAGNRTLRDFAAPMNQNTVLLPTVVDTNRYMSMRSKTRDIFTIGWIGSPSTSVYLDQLVEPLSILGKEGPVSFIVIGGTVKFVSHVDVVEIPWSEESEIQHINTFDVGVMPLPDDNWAKGKCGFKLIQYMACGIPVIASPVGANQDIVNKSCGFFAGSSDEWLNAFRTIRDNPEAGEMMGWNARERIVSEYSLSRNLPVISNVIKSVCSN